MIATAVSPVITFDQATHTYHVDGERWPSVTGILKATGLSTNWDRLPSAVREAAAWKRSLGQDVHTACALLDRGDLSWAHLDEALFPYVEAWERYTRQRGVASWIAIEAIVYHPTWRYIGTLDRLAVLETGGLVLIDVKCGDPDDAAGRFQTAAYTEAARVCGVSQSQAAIERECVQLYPSGKFKAHPYASRDDWKVFQAALVVFRAGVSCR